MFQLKLSTLWSWSTDGNCITTTTQNVDRERVPGVPAAQQQQKLGLLFSGICSFSEGSNKGKVVDLAK